MDLALLKQRLDEMKNSATKEVDKKHLVDIQTVEIDPALPKQERLLQYLEQIQNPYCFKCGEMVVKIEFSGDMTLQEKLIHYFKSSN